MAMNRTELEKYIEEDVKKYAGIRRPLKARLVQRLLVRKVRLTKLHPNPDDEFTWTTVGPKDSIVEDYMEYIRKLESDSTGLDPLEPLMIEKMFPKGYTILNGHHRWAAGMRLGLTSMAVRVVNMTHAEDIQRQIEKSDRLMRAAFDLDEVLLSTAPDMEEEDNPPFPLNVFCKDRLRTGVPALIQELHRLGFDIWVYSHTTNPEERVRALFRAYGDEPDVYINGVSQKRNNEKSLEAFNGKYNFTVHIDTESMIFTRPQLKQFDEVKLDSHDADWALNVMREIETRSNPEYIFPETQE